VGGPSGVVVRCGCGRGGEHVPDPVDQRHGRAEEQVAGGALGREAMGVRRRHRLRSDEPEVHQPQLMRGAVSIEQRKDLGFLCFGVRFHLYAERSELAEERARTGVHPLQLGQLLLRLVLLDPAGPNNGAGLGSGQQSAIGLHVTEAPQHVTPGHADANVGQLLIGADRIEQSEFTTGP
jgi:hypothetical protein